MFRGALAAAPHVGSDAWHIIVQARQSGTRMQASGRGQSGATGRLTALAAERAVDAAPQPMTMADLVSADEALAFSLLAIQRATAEGARIFAPV